MLIGLFSVLLSCTGKQSSIEGRLVDWNNHPLGNVKITASQVDGIVGYEQREAITSETGAFVLEGLFPTSKYVVKPWSAHWTTDDSITVESGPENETLVIQDLVITGAYDRTSGSLVIDLQTGETRFEVTSEGVIDDTESGLQWLIGPNLSMGFSKSVQWVRLTDVAGGGWRMPTTAEVAGLFIASVTPRHLDPVFKTPFSKVWTEPFLDSSAFYFDFQDGKLRPWGSRTESRGHCVFAVRERNN